ncbi:MAG: LamG-like jellyroll fold domain-containing protein [Verrucomicrobiota bacterium]|nr:LamG-like jellyroll fold domain-containing protein [Verrucomicrobiota bacterium]
MKVKMKLVMLLCTTLFSLTIYAESKLVLDFNFEKHSPSGTEVKGGKIIKIPGSDALIGDKKRKSNFLHLNGRNEVLQFDLSEESKKVLNGSFTFEFDFFTEKLPSDSNYHNPGAYNIEIFSAFDDNGKRVLNLYGNRYNRFNGSWVNKKEKSFGLQSTWNHNNNYEVCGILRNKWYHVAFVYNKKAQTLELYLDGEKLGNTKTSGDLKTIKDFRFGGNPKGNHKGMLSGGIDNIRLSSGILYDKETDSATQKKSWQRLHDTARKTYSEFLLPENPKWADHHPRMLLTPPRIEELKANLKKGKGPELVKRLITRCNEMINTASPQFFDKMTTGHNVGDIIRPAILSLATILTGNKKYAEYAAKIVTEYAETLGYYDMRTQLVRSAGQGKPLMAVALTYDWGYDHFTPEQRRKVRQYLLEMAKGTYDYYTKKSESSAQSDALAGCVANWSAMSYSTLGNASLAVMGETSAPVRRWLNYAKFRTMQYGLFAVGTEGCFYEMPDYLAYGAGPLFIFMEAYYTAGGDDLLAMSNFAKTPNFLPYIFYPYSNKMMPLRYSSQINGLHKSDSYVMGLLRYKFRTETMEWNWQKIYDGKPWNESWNIFPIIWFEPEKEAISSPGQPLAKWFKSQGFMGFRSSWEKDAIAGTFTAYPAEIMAHDQSDRGQFNLYGYQGRWIIDVGGRSNPEHGYRGAHNLITVDNKERQYKPRAGHNYHLDAFITNFCHSDNVMTASGADLSNSYRYIYNWGMETVDSKNKKYSQDRFDFAGRQLLFMREKTAPAYLLVLDKIKEDDKEHSYTLNLHTASENEVLINGNSAKLI